MATTKPKGRGAVATARRKQKQPPWLWIGTAALVLILAAAAIVSSGGGGSDDTTAEGIEETRTVSVNGTPLPEYESDAGGDAAVEKTIPEVTGKSFDGSPVEIRNDGRAKVIIFVAHWCPHCQKEIPLLADWLESNKLPDGVDLYTVSTGVTSNRPNYPPSAWLEKEGWTVKTLADSEEGTVADAFGLTAFPYFVASDASGKVVVRASGEISTDAFADLGRRAASGQ